MKFEVGDKVRFLNEKGSGVVSRIVSPSLVFVMIEDGFEIPTAPGDIIKAELDDPAGRFFHKESGDVYPEVGKMAADSNLSVPEPVSPLLRLGGRTMPSTGVYLAYVPHSQRWLVTGSLDMYLVNQSPYELFYTLLLIENDQSYTGMDADRVPPYSKMFIQTVEREEVKDWNQGIIQLLFFQETMKRVLLPASCTFHIRESRLSKEDSYTETALFKEKALLSLLVETGRHGAAGARSAEGRSGAGQVTGRHSADLVQQPLIEKHRIAPGEAEVDLHIEELVAEESDLDPEHILKIQMDYFKRCLDSAFSQAYHRIIFIHGVGNGTLKSEIRLVLDSMENVEYHTARMAKYGVGALEVFLHQPKK